MIVTFSFSFLLHSTRQIKFSTVGIVSLILSRRHFIPCFCDEAKRVAIFILCIPQKSSSGPKKIKKKPSNGRYWYRPKAGKKKTQKGSRYFEK